MVAALVLKSSVSTLFILDRQARKDVIKVANFLHHCGVVLTSPEAIKTYIAIGRLLQIIWMCLVLVWLFIQEWANREVARHSAVVEAVEAPHVEETANDPIEVTATVEEAPSCPIHVEYKAPAIDWAQMTRDELRKACQKAGIRWSKVNGGKHLTVAQMVERLSAV